jgi:hypothetical protein
MQVQLYTFYSCWYVFDTLREVQKNLSKIFLCITDLHILLTIDLNKINSVYLKHILKGIYILNIGKVICFLYIAAVDF